MHDCRDCEFEAGGKCVFDEKFNAPGANEAQAALLMLVRTRRCALFIPKLPPLKIEPE